MEGARVLEYAITVGNAGKGSAKVTVEFGTQSVTDSFSGGSGGDGGVTYIHDGFEEDSDSFSITMQAIEKAMYLYSVDITLSVPEGVGDNIGSDEKPSIPDGGGSSGGGDGGETGGSSGGGNGSGGSGGPATGEIPDGALEPRYNVVNPDTYYLSVDLTLTGDDLRDELNDLISDKTNYSYGNCSYALVYIDQSLTDDRKITSIWDGDQLPAEWNGGNIWNKEHVWPRSLLKDAEKGDVIHNDLHNLHASCAKANTYRGSKWFKEGGDNFFPNIEPGTLSGSHSYTGDWRGDAARTCFYMYTCYDFLKISDNSKNSDNTTIGYLSELLEWNREDPVDEFEARRNDRVSMYQNNRNPFIDHPELADQLFE